MKYFSIVPLNLVENTYAYMIKAKDFRSNQKKIRKSNEGNHLQKRLSGELS